MTKFSVICFRPRTAARAPAVLTLALAAFFFKVLAAPLAVHANPAPAEVTAEAFYTIGPEETPAAGEERVLLKATKAALADLTPYVENYCRQHGVAVGEDELSALLAWAADISVVDRKRAAAGAETRLWCQVKGTVAEFRLEQALKLVKDLGCLAAYRRNEEILNANEQEIAALRQPAGPPGSEKDAAAAPQAAASAAEKGKTTPGEKEAREKALKAEKASRQQKIAANEKVFLAAVQTARGQRFLAGNEWERAKDAFNLALAYDPAYAVARAGLGAVWYAQNQCARARIDYEAAAALSPDSLYALLGRADVYRRIGELDKALADYARVAEIAPRYWPVYYNRGLIFRAKGQPEAAAAEFTKALELNPKHIPSLVGRAQAYRDTRRYDQALADLNAAIAVSPRDAELLLLRGSVFQQAGQEEKALADYSLAKTIRPDFFAPLWARAVLLDQLGRSSEAAEAYETLINEAPAVYARLAQQAKERLRF